MTPRRARSAREVCSRLASIAVMILSAAYCTVDSVNAQPAPGARPISGRDDGDAEPGQGSRRRAGKRGGDKSAVQALVQQSNQFMQSGQYTEAERSSRQALALAEQSGNARALATSSGILGTALLKLGHPAEAESLLRRSIALREAEFGPDARATLSLMGRLGMALAHQGKLAEAVAQLAETVKREDRSSPRGAAEITMGHMQFGTVLSMAGQTAAAEEHLLKAIDNGASSADRNHQRLLEQANFRYAKALMRSKKSDRALDPARKAVALAESVFGTEHVQTVRALVMLGQVLVARGETDEAESVMSRAAPLAEKLLGPRSSDTATVQFVLGLLAEKSGRLDQADAAMKRGAEVMRLSGTPTQQIGAASHYAQYLERRERDAEALEQLRFALDTIDRLFAGTRGMDTQSREAFATRYAPLYYETVQLLVKLHRASPRAGYDRQAFSVVSRTQSRMFSEMLRQADVKAFAGDPKFQKMVSERDALTLQVSKARGARATRTQIDLPDDSDNDGRDDPLVRARTERAAANAAREVAGIEASLKAAEERLARDYPRYMELVQPKPVEVAELQRQLRPGEALLSFFMARNETSVYLVTPDRFVMRPAGAARKVIADLIWNVRHPSESAGGSIASLAELDPVLLNRLYQVLVQPVESLLRPGQKVIVVADGPLFTLPLEMLVTSYGPAERERFAAARAARKGLLTEYGSLAYLGDRYRFSYLPSLSALVSQRQFGKPRVAFDRELVSFADPIFANEAGAPDTGDATRAIKPSSGAMTASAGSMLLQRLPETADEANGIAKVLSGKASIFLREKAQERTAKTTDLHATRFVHFATHGLLGGEFLQVKQSLEDGSDTLNSLPAQGTQRNLLIAAAAAAVADESPAASESGHHAAAPAGPSGLKKIGQPALVLTLVGNTQGEDGLLTMGEVIESLNLNADIVVLSACNTAGETAEASSGEGFAGLTRAFMYAGARSLIVSHWAVDSLSTTMLVTTAFSTLKTGQSLDESMAQARAKVRSSFGNGYSRAHPFFWAPFVQIGD